MLKFTLAVVLGLSRDGLILILSFNRGNFISNIILRMFIPFQKGGLLMNLSRLMLPANLYHSKTIV